MNTTEFDLLVKVIPAMVGVIGLFPVLYAQFAGRKGHLRDEYKFAKEFLSDLKESSDMHPFAKEKGLQALANDRYVEPDEVEFLLQLSKPVRALRDFISGRAYLELARDTERAHLRFRLKYQRKWSRNWRKWTYTTLYVVFAIFAYSPILLEVWVRMNSAQLALSVLATAAVFAPCAWLSLREAAHIYRAEVLIRSQETSMPPPDAQSPPDLRLAS